MRLLVKTAILSLMIHHSLADSLPDLYNSAPNESHVKERISPPEGSKLYDVWYAKGNRIYQCNPEKQGFQHWYNVQTHAFLYPTKGHEAPFNKDGMEIGQLSAAPLNLEQQMANPIDTIPVLYDYKDGSWAGSSRPLSTTTKEEGREARGDNIHLDDHLSSVITASSDGYLSHAKYIVRLGSLDGVVPPADHCTEKGMIVNKPFSAYFMFYTDEEGYAKVTKEKVEWDRMVEEYTPEKLRIVKEKAAHLNNSTALNEQEKEASQNQQASS